MKPGSWGSNLDSVPSKPGQHRPTSFSAPGFPRVRWGRQRRGLREAVDEDKARAREGVGESAGADVASRAFAALLVMGPNALPPGPRAFHGTPVPDNQEEKAGARPGEMPAPGARLPERRTGDPSASQSALWLQGSPVTRAKGAEVEAHGRGVKHLLCGPGAQTHGAPRSTRLTAWAPTPLPGAGTSARGKQNARTRDWEAGA